MSAGGRPSVSVLIPGYRTTFLRACLDSALNQSWTDMEIVVGDDCPTDALRSIVEEYAGRDPRVRLLDFPGRGGRANVLALFGAARGEYVKYLNDDDLLEPQCVERMLRCLDAFPGVKLVTSHRRLVDAEGKRIPDNATNRRLVSVDSIIEGRSLIEEMLARRINMVGEPTSVMFRKRDLAASRPDIMSFAGRRAASNGDVSMWVTLLTGGDAIYLATTLSSFRQHDDQRQREPGFEALGRRGWKQLCADARKEGLLPDLAPAGLRSRPLGAKPWWSAEHSAQYEELVRTSEQGDPRKGLSLAAGLSEGLPDDSLIAAAHGSLLLENGRTAEARARLEDAVAKAPWHPDCRRELGMACLAAGDPEGAWLQLCTAVHAAPRDPTARKVLARLAKACGPPPGSVALAGTMDAPADGARVRESLSVDGWVLVHPAAMGSVLEIEVSVDGQTVAAVPNRLPRSDVHAHHPALAPFNPDPGFQVPLLLHGLSPGEHHVGCTARCGSTSRRLGEARVRVLAPDDGDGGS
jgi:glycosyltransferase involved in cell wall biosynthesis